MNADASNLRTATRARPLRGAAEHRFYIGFAIVMAAGLFLGFARTFFLRPWFPEHVASHAPPEPIFLLHGAVSTLWFVLLIVQPSLVAAGRINTHRRLGVAGAVLAAIIFVVGIVGSLIAAKRGFIGISGSSLEFLMIPVAALTMFGAFATLAIINRHDPQSHKRYMLLASISVLEAAVVRWPFAII